MIKKLFVDETDNTLIQFFRYCFVGGFATVVDWGISAAMFFWLFGAQTSSVFSAVPWFTNAMLCNGVSFIAGLVVNYFLSTFWIFKSSRMQNKFFEFLSFAAIGVVGLLITFGVTYVFEITLSDVTSLYQIIGKVVSTAISFLWNFFARKYLVFGKKKADEKGSD